MPYYAHLKDQGAFQVGPLASGLGVLRLLGSRRFPRWGHLR